MFYARRRCLRELYKDLDVDQKYIYKYYLYSRRQFSERECDIMWEYLNAPDELALFFEHEVSIMNRRYGGE